MNGNSIDRFFDRIERLLSHPEIKVEKRKTVSFTVTEGDNEAIDRAIEILEGLRASEETTEENKVDTESSNESFSEEFKGDNA